MSKRKKSSNTHAHQVLSRTSISTVLPLGVLASVAIIAIVVFVAYLPSISGDYVLDDDRMLTENVHVKTSEGLWRIWCTTEAIDYWPVTNTTFWIEWRIWGMNSTGYHVTNLILHIVESLLIWLILRRLSIPGAFLAAVIFAVHPVNVESVAWIAQRKNTMAMLFFLLSILCYLKHLRSGHISCTVPAHGTWKLFTGRWYWLSLFTFAMAMLSKGSVVVLPVMLLGIVWRLRPLSRWDLVSTGPFFAVAVILGGVNVWFQTHGNEVAIRAVSFSDRLLGAGGVVWFYLYKAFLPVDLAFIYRQWQIEVGNPLWWLPLLTVLAITAVLWLCRGGWGRPILFAWGFFCVALVPVMGFVDVGFMLNSLVADHYQHIAIIGVIALVSAGFGVWRRCGRDEVRWAATVAAVAAVGILSFLTWRQCEIFRDKLTLYQATLEKNPDSWIAQNNMGLSLTRTGRNQEAIEYFRQALRLQHNYLDAHINLADALDQIGRPYEAIEQYRQALSLSPDHPLSHNNLGNVLIKTGQTQEAIEHFRHALRSQYNFPEAHNNLGASLFQTGRPQEAIEQFEIALQFRPDCFNAYKNLALAYADLHQSSEAIFAAQKALGLARFQGQTEQAKQMEDWLNSYSAGLPNQPNTPSSETVPRVP
jgi:protein O-mannosyl-transferase